MRSILDQSTVRADGDAAARSPLRPLLVSAADAATLLGIGRTSFYALIREGVFVPVRIGRSVRFPVTDLEVYVASLADGRDARAS